MPCSKLYLSNDLSRDGAATLSVLRLSINGVERVEDHGEQRPRGSLDRACRGEHGHHTSSVRRDVEDGSRARRGWPHRSAKHPNAARANAPPATEYGWKQCQPPCRIRRWKRGEEQLLTARRPLQIRPRRRRHLPSRPRVVHVEDVDDRLAGLVGRIRQPPSIR